MSDPLTDLINDVQHNGIRWVTLAMLFGLIRKERRNNSLKKRDAAYFHNQHEIMKALGVGGKWKDGPKLGFYHTDLRNLRRFFLLSRKAMMHPNQIKEMFHMKSYLKKLGSRKFQAYLIVTVTNIIMLTGYLLNVADIQDVANQWMPIINLGAQVLTTIVYQIVQGAVDKEAQKQQVYVMPAAADPAPNIVAPVLSFDELMSHVEHVNSELNLCLEQIKSGDLSQIPKEAVQLYLDIAELIQRKESEEP